MVKAIKIPCSRCAGTGQVPRGEYLRKLRGKRTLQEIADTIGVTRSYLSRVELGRDLASPKVRRAYGELHGAK